MLTCSYDNFRCKGMGYDYFSASGSEGNKIVFVHCYRGEDICKFSFVPRPKKQKKKSLYVEMECEKSATVKWIKQFRAL